MANLEDYVYLAGLFDGEGSLYILHRIPKEHEKEKSPRFWLQMQIGMTDKPVIDWLKDTFGGSVLTEHHKEERWKTCYRWRLNNKLAATLLQQIRPWLKVKHRKADIAQEFTKILRYARHRRLSEDEIAAREMFRVRIRAA